MNVLPLELIAKQEPLIEDFTVIKDAIVFSISLPIQTKPSLSTRIAIVKLLRNCRWSLDLPRTHTTGQSASEAENAACCILQDSINHANRESKANNQTKVTHAGIRAFFDDVHTRFNRASIPHGYSTSLAKQNRRNFLLDYLTRGTRTI